MHAEVKLFYFWQNSSIFRLTPYLAIPCVLSFRYLIVLMPCFSTFPYSSVSSVALPNCSSVLSCPCPEVLLFSTVPLSHYPTVPFSYSTIPLFSVLLSCSCRPFVGHLLCCPVPLSRNLAVPRGFRGRRLFPVFGMQVMCVPILQT